MKNNIDLKCETFKEAIEIKQYAENLGLIYDEQFNAFNEKNFIHCKKRFCFNVDQRWDRDKRLGGHFSFVYHTSVPDKTKSLVLDTKDDYKKEILEFAINLNLLPSSDIEIALKKCKKVDNLIVLSSDYDWKIVDNCLVCYEK